MSHSLKIQWKHHSIWKLQSKYFKKTQSLLSETTNAIWKCVYKLEEGGMPEIKSFEFFACMIIH